MRPMYLIGGAAAACALTGVLFWTRMAPAQTPSPLPPPATEAMTITVAEDEVRSGPSNEFYPTSKLRLGDKVEVIRNSNDKHPGWLAIKPPPGSFSWIKSGLVGNRSKNTAYVNTPEEVPFVAVKAGSSVSNVEPNVESAKLTRGTQLLLLGEAKPGAGFSWFPIAATLDEVRYIPEGCVAKSVTQQNTPAPSSGFVPPPGSQVSLVDQGDAALQQARQFYQQAAQSPDLQTRTAAISKLASMQVTFVPGAVQQPGYPYNTAALQGSAAPKAPALGSPAQPGTGFVQTSATVQGQGGSNWSKWGTLRRTAFTKDNQPLYKLLDDRGAPIAYAVAASGLTLEPYVGSMVCVYGPTTYRTEDYPRVYYTIVSHLALPPRQ